MCQKWLKLLLEVLINASCSSSHQFDLRTFEVVCDGKAIPKRRVRGELERAAVDGGTE